MVFIPYVTAKEWRDSGIIPTSGLLAWHMYEAAVSGNNIIFDYSGNGRHIDSAALNAPSLQADILYGNPGWYFNGVDTVPLNYTGAVNVKHAFILASADEATFSAFRGLLGGETSGNILVSNTGGATSFFNLGFGAGFEYRKSDVVFPEAGQTAPMLTPALLEVSFTGGFGLDGIQVGQQLVDITRKWKGWFFEQLLFDRVLDLSERRRLMLYFNIKFSQWRAGLPLRFPSDDLMPFRRSRFYAAPLEYKETTDHFEFEDRGRTFNEAADTPPRRWEYGYKKRTAAQTVIFDEFWNQARIAHPFTFLETHRDGRQIEWADVRIEDYNRKHDAHKSFENDVEFKLVKYP